MLDPYQKPNSSPYLQAGKGRLMSRG